MEGIRFNRFKKKSLILLHDVLDDGRLLKKILNMKILQTLQTFHFKQGIVEEKTLEGHSGSVNFLVKINGNTIANGSDDSDDATIKLWDIITGNCLKTLKGHSDEVNCLVKINEYSIASASCDNTIKIWDIITGNCLKTLEGHSKFVKFLVKINGNTIASASYYIPYFYCFIITRDRKSVV